MKMTVRGLESGEESKSRKMKTMRLKKNSNLTQNHIYSSLVKSNGIASVSLRVKSGPRNHWEKPKVKWREAEKREVQLKVDREV